MIPEVLRSFMKIVFILQKDRIRHDRKDSLDGIKEELD